MILKRMDETILSGQYDLEDSEEVTVVLIAPELKMGSDNKLVADWHEVDRNTVKKNHLYGLFEPFGFISAAPQT